jgi:hypothetical protein
MPEILFSLITILPLPIWISMLLFPRTRFTQRMVTSYWPFIALSGVYALTLLLALFTGVGFDLSYEGVQRSLTRDWGFVAVWAHLIVFDLFIGVWIFRDAKYWGINPGIFLLLTLFTGPLGLGSYLFFRERRARGDPIRTLN